MLGCLSGTPPPRLRGRARGISLVELLIVLAVIAVGAMVGVKMFTTLYKSQQLSVAGGDIRAFLQEASAQMQNRNREVFVRVSQIAATPTRPARWHFEMIEDTNNNAAIDGIAGVGVPNPDTLIQVYDAPPAIALADTSTTRIDSVNWSVDSADNAARSLGVDFLKRAINPLTGRQIPGVAVLSVSHNDMTTGHMTPLVVYQVRVNPVWDVTVRRR